MTEPSVEPSVRVSTIELFFDLVFVFTLTQLTAVLADDLGAVNVARVALMLAVILWMYFGYAWLTNAVAPTSRLRRGLLITGMAGFFGIALAVPSAFAGGGLVFGLGYFVVNAVHTGLFLHDGGPDAVATMSRIAPFNLTSATLVLVGGAVPSVGWRTGLWLAAVALLIATPYLRRPQRWALSASHFVERHGLVVIVALGESIVAIGVGAAGLPVDAGLLAVAVLGLVLAYLLWWTYFGGDEIAAEHALDRVPPEQRAMVALRAYGWAHYPILLGIVALAAGVKKAIGYAFDSLTWPQAVVLGGGVALFLLGDVAYRRVLRIGRRRYRTVGALAALATAPIGVWQAAAQLVALVVVVLAMLIWEDRSTRAATHRHRA